MLLITAIKLIQIRSKMSYLLACLDDEIAELKANFATELAELEARRPGLIAAAIKEADEKVAAATASAAALRASLSPAQQAPIAFLLPPSALPQAPAAEAAIPHAAQAAMPTFFKLILGNGKAVGVKEEGKTAPLRAVEASKGQLFKAIPISSGPHAGFVELEAVGGRQAGKVLDNSAKKNTSIVFFRRCLVNNAAQRWKLVDGKLASAVSGLFMAKGDAAGFGFSEAGDVFTFAAAEPPLAAGAGGEPVAAEPVAAEPKPKEKRLASVGTLAWAAFIKHTKATMPERLVGLTKGSEMLMMAKTIKDGNGEAYNSFVADFKAAHASQQQPQEQEEEAVA